MCQNPIFICAQSAAAVVVVSEIAAVEVAAEEVVIVVVLVVDSVIVDSVVVSDMELETETALSSGFSFVNYKNANTTKAIMTITRSMLEYNNWTFDFPGVFLRTF
ncbi:MAG: hypothetical protein ACLR1R_11205 [Ruminococcus callidus]